MANWNITIKLGDLVQRWKDREIGIPELADLVSARIKESGWRDITPYPHTFDEYLAIFEKSEYRDDYQASFEAIYDLADADLVCIETY